MRRSEFAVTPRFTDREHYMLSFRFNEPHAYTDIDQALKALEDVINTEPENMYTIYTINKLQEALISIWYEQSCNPDIQIATKVAAVHSNRLGVYVSQFLWRVIMPANRVRTCLAAAAFYQDAISRFKLCTDMSDNDKEAIVNVYQSFIDDILKENMERNM